MNLELYFSLLLVGLLGSTHCMGMCGGLQQLFIQMSPQQNSRNLLLYHAGRLTSYALITLLVATVLSRFATQTAGLVPYAMAIRLLAAGVMIWIGVNHFIKIALPHSLRIATDRLWKNIRGLVQPFLPPKNSLHVFIIGVAWGWLPCSLVYSALAIALSADSVSGSVMAMLCFGFGTMPALIGIGFLSKYLQKNPHTKKWLAGLLILIGVYAFVSVFL